MKKTLHSNLLRLFPFEVLVEINKIIYSDLNNTQRGRYVQDYLTEKGYQFLKLGSGTNRLGIQMEDFIVKIALDKHGIRLDRVPSQRDL